MAENAPQDWIQRFLAGDRRALARIITRVENRTGDVPLLMQQIWSRVGRARVVGVTGPPGAGKSTLVDRLLEHLRARGQRVGVVAVDPSSPFSGGAILGDRVRMQKHFLDEGVFIRSLSTRGRHGGLARATRDVVHLLDAFGFDVIIIETVGVGQTELDVMKIAQSTIVVLVPEAGDTIQVMKAGLLEIADLFVVNKADRDGARRLGNELKAMLHMRASTGWEVPVLLTEAAAGKGTAELLERIDAHGALASQRDEATVREAEWRDILRDELSARLERTVGEGHLEGVARRVRTGEIDPYGAALESLADTDLLAHLLAAGREW